MTVTLRAPTLAECQLVREWRNAPDVLPTLRTGYKTEEEQAAFFRDVVSDFYADHRYYAIDANGRFVGFGGLTHLSRVPGEAEISLIIDPSLRGLNLGSYAVDALLAKARGLGLKSVIGEAYVNNPAVRFWLSTIARCGMTGSVLFRKDLHDSDRLPST